MQKSTKELLLAILCILLAMITIQSGASLAKQLFPIVGPEGTTALRLGFSAAILCLIFKPPNYRSPYEICLFIIFFNICTSFKCIR